MFILWILAVILVVSGIVATLRKEFLWGVVQAAESTAQHVGYQEAPVAQTVLIKPGWSCAAGVQGFTTRSIGYLRTTARINVASRQLGAPFRRLGASSSRR